MTERLGIGLVLLVIALAHLDFSINQPPWCPACRHHDPPRHERRHQDEW